MITDTKKIFFRKKLSSWILGFGVGLLLVISSCSSTKNTAKNTAAQKNGSAVDYIQALLQFEPWAESQWKDYPDIPGAGYFGDGKTTGNGGIRGTSGIALSYAILAKAFPNSAESKNWIKKVEAALRYMEETHKGNNESVFAVDGKKWGVVAGSALNDPEGWQSSLRAGTMGFTAFLLEKDIDPKVVEGCKRAVAAEADWLSKKPVPSGYKLDSKGEENAWQSNIVTLAAAWMPNDPRYFKWLETAKNYLANTYTVPSDSSGPLKQWIKTQTLFPSYAMENHGFYHPSYQMVAGMSLGDSYLMAQMVNPKVAEEIKPFAEHNVEHVWQFLKGLILDNGDLAFPSGLDWSLHSFEHISYLEWLANHFNDANAQWAVQRLAKQILYRQSVNEDGRFVGPSCPDGFYREAVEARRIAMAYLQNQAGGAASIEGKPISYFITHYSDVGLIVQHSENMLATVSYGPKTMALVYPLNGKSPSRQYLISPNTSSFIGPEGKTKLLHFEKSDSGFKAELYLQTPKGRNSRMIIESMPDAVVFIEIPDAGSKLPSGEWFLNAIENDTLSGGMRKIIWEGDSTIIKERSGNISQADSGGWINIDNWIGYVAASDGHFLYHAASNYNRNGAAEDKLSFLPKNENVPRAIIVLPGKDAAVTARVKNSLKWILMDKECRLSFTRPDGSKAELKVAL